MTSIVVRGLSRHCLTIGNNGFRSKVCLGSQLSRAFAVAPLRAAITGSHSPLLAKVNLSPEIQGSRQCSSGDHVKLWTAERVMSVVLLGAIPAAIAVPSPAVEAFLALSLTIHSHWGIEALVHDYVRPAVFGEVIPRLSVALVYGLSMMTFGGLCYFIYTDVGLINAVGMLWKL